MCKFKKKKLKKDSGIFDAFTQIAISSAGYKIAKNNKDHIDEMLAWWDIFNGAEKLLDVQKFFENGMSSLVGMVSDDPYLQLQIRYIIDLVDVEVSGPTLPESIGKYRELINVFMSGVVAVEH